MAGKDDALKAFKLWKALLGNSLNALDRGKPLGLYVLWPEKVDKLEELAFPVVFFAPVADEKRFLEALPKLGVKVGKEEGGLRKLTLSDDREMMLRLTNGHAYAAFEAKWLRGKLPAFRGGTGHDVFW